MSSWLALATAVTFVWLGMVIAISFLEAPGVPCGRCQRPDRTPHWTTGLPSTEHRRADPGFRLGVRGCRGTADHAASSSALRCPSWPWWSTSCVRRSLTRRFDRVLAGEDVSRSPVERRGVPCGCGADVTGCSRYARPGAIWGRGMTGAVDFDSVFSVEYPCVLRTVFLICHDSQLAQDAFVELLRHWENVGQPGTWRGMLDSPTGGPRSRLPRPAPGPYWGR